MAYSVPILQSQHEIKLVCLHSDGSAHSCSTEQACASESFSYPQSSHDSLINWVVDYQLACRPAAFVSLLGTTLFAGFFIGSLLFLPLADKLGRKPIVLAGLVIQLLALIILFAVDDLTYLFIFCAIIGLRAPMTSQTAYLLLSELVTPSWREFSSTYFNGIDSALPLVLGLVFLLIQNWVPLFISITVFISLLIPLIAIYVPESPRFYIAKRNYAAARQVYASIAA